MYGMLSLMHWYNTSIYFPLMIYINLSILSSIYFIYQCFQPGQPTNQIMSPMIEKLVDKLPQSQLKAVNANLTPFPALGQYVGVVPLFLPKELVCIIKTPKISVANHHGSNLKPILHLHNEYHSHTHAPLLT